MPGKPSFILSKTLIEHITTTFLSYKSENELLGNGFNHVTCWSYKNQSFHMVAAWPLF